MWASRILLCAVITSSSILCLAASPTAYAQQLGTARPAERTLDVATLEDLLIKAQREGYKISLQKEPKFVRVIITKEGKTAEGYGLLGAKWDQRQVWSVLYVRTGDKLTLAETGGVVERKPPVAGTWQETQRLVGLPPPLEATR